MDTLDYNNKDDLGHFGLSIKLVQYMRNIKKMQQVRKNNCKES